ncbi:hypothetical protein SKAU_G00190620 [Synaphobranchus kaupii]|uniref:Sushi domain-containing protein n=1 Tax=Synaphobranchus kaupii TaxID=118154 RepID=A0A9Q1FDD6_SYNKA|nr:hypothetical protein SKAU_G00190620 [Synaphobranchus kaupii]
MTLTEEQEEYLQEVPKELWAEGGHDIGLMRPAGQPPYEPENGGYTCHPSPCHRLIHGTVIEYFCDEGYALKGDYKYLTCENGEWDSPMQISCHLSQGTVLHSPLGVPALSIVASTASSVALIVLFVLLQPKLKSFHHSRREQGVPGHPVSIAVEGVQVSLPSYEEAVYGSGGGAVAPSESRVQIVLSEGPQAEGGEAPGPSGAERDTAQDAYTWWDWVFRGCVIASALIFTFTLVQGCYFRHLIRNLHTSTHTALILSPLQLPQGRP